MVLEQLLSIWKIIKMDPYLTPQTQMNFLKTCCQKKNKCKFRIIVSIDCILKIIFGAY